MTIPNTIITCCPACKTRFKVTPGQLKVAENTVRCGSCLAVFSAIEHQLSQRTEASTPPKAKVFESQPVTPPSNKKTNNELETHTKENTPAPKVPSSVTEPKVSEPQETIIENASEIPTLIVETEPVTIALKANKKAGLSGGWIVACMLTLILLAGQQLWFKRSTLYWEPMLHPLYVHICSQLKCPDFYQQDIQLIENQQLVIQQHSLYEGAAHVALLLKNHATFEQPFPALKLTFKDLKGRIVSHRTFQPKEYLDTTVVNMLAMPSQTPVQIGLDIMTPGSRGVSYELELLAPQL